MPGGSAPSNAGKVVGSVTGPFFRLAKIILLRHGDLVMDLATMLNIYCKQPVALRWNGHAVHEEGTR